jgi:hypothetical protein
MIFAAGPARAEARLAEDDGSGRVRVGRERVAENRRDENRRINKLRKGRQIERMARRQSDRDSGAGKRSAGHLAEVAARRDLIRALPAGHPHPHPHRRDGTRQPRRQHESDGGQRKDQGLRMDLLTPLT